jgi:L-ascorbate metabolism protein UlaG (beta-lactamase superfamily)
MQVEWYGQSAFQLTDGGTTVVIDPFGDMTALEGRGLRWDYPAIGDVEADLLLITHEHRDHNAVDAIGGEPVILRSTAGRLDSPIGEVLAVASEHDAAAGTERGPNTLFAFAFGGLRVAHLGDLGQRTLRDEQVRALGPIDLLFAPVGGQVTIGADQATEIAARLGARIVVPMHYRTERIGFLEPVDAFLERAAAVERLASPLFDLDALPSTDGPLVVVPAAP